MAVPSSGSLSLFGLAKEKTHDDYNSTIPVGTWQDNFFSYASLTDATTGAGNYDLTNTNSANRPDNVTPHKISEWYGYDHDATATSGACIQVVHTNFSASNQYSTTGCSSSNGITANSGLVNGGGSDELSFFNRYVRYRNITGATKNYNIRLYRGTTACASLKVYKGYYGSSTGYTTTGMTLVHNKTNTGYTTYTGTIDDDDELLVILEFSNLSGCNTTSASCSISNLYYHGTACSYNGTMLNVPVLGSPGSTAYTYSQPWSAYSAAYNARNQSSAWSTAYIHQCAGSNFTVGNNIYQSNGTSGSKVQWGTNGGWRGFGYATSTWTLNGYPGNSIWNVLAVKDTSSETYNVEEIYTASNHYEEI